MKWERKMGQARVRRETGELATRESLTDLTLTLGKQVVEQLDRIQADLAAASPGVPVMTRGEFVGWLLMTSMDEFERSQAVAAQEKKDKERLIVPATHVPKGMAEAGDRLRKIKEGVK